MTLSFDYTISSERLEHLKWWQNLPTKHDLCTVLN